MLDPVINEVQQNSFTYFTCLYNKEQFMVAGYFPYNYQGWTLILIKEFAFPEGVTDTEYLTSW